MSPVYRRPARAGGGRSPAAEHRADARRARRARRSRCAAPCRPAARASRRLRSSAVELLGRDAALGADDEHDVARVGGVERQVGQRAADAVGSRTSTRRCRGPRARARVVRLERRRRRGSTPGAPAWPPRARSAAQRARALRGLRRVPPRDAARRLPRHDLVDAELGRRLHRELVAVALRERLHEHDARARRGHRRRVRDPDDDRASARRTRTSPLEPRARAVADRRPSRRRAPAARPRRGALRRRSSVTRRRPGCARAVGVRRSEEVQRHRVSRSGSGRAASRTGPDGTRARCGAGAFVRLRELLDERALLARRARVGRHHVHADAQVAALRAAQRRDAAALDREHVAALHARRASRGRPAPSRDSIVVVVPRIASVIDTSRVASRSSPSRLKTLVRRDGDLEVQVAVRAAGRAHLARAGQLQPQAGLDAGRDVDRHRATRAHAALALARRARVRDGRAVALAGAARLRGDDVAEQAAHRALHLTGAVADVAGDRRACPAGSTSPGTSRTARRCRPRCRGARRRRRRRGRASTRTRASWPRSRRERGRPARWPPAAPKNVSKMSPNPPKPPRAAAERRVVAAHVVARALVGVAQHVVGVRDELEALGRVLARVHVGVQLAREASVRLLDLVGARVARDAEDLVVVSHNRLSVPRIARDRLVRCRAQRALSSSSSSRVR